VAVRELELAQYRRHVRLDGLGRDVELPGDLLVRIAAREVPQATRRIASSSSGPEIVLVTYPRAPARMTAPSKRTLATWTPGSCSASVWSLSGSPSCPSPPVPPAAGVAPADPSPGPRGGAWLLDVSGLVAVDVAVVIALVGVALVVSAWVGRARGLIAMGILLGLAVALFGVIDVPLRGEWATPSTGRIRSPRSTTPTTSRSASSRSTCAHSTSRARPVVPAVARVVVDGHAGVGTVNSFRRSTHECCPTDVRRVRPGLTGAGTLVLSTEVGVGTIEITD
jgi:hypothetical protein